MKGGNTLLIKTDILQHGIRVEKLIDILKKVPKNSVCIIENSQIQILNIPVKYSYTILDKHRGIINFYEERYIDKDEQRRKMIEVIHEKETNMKENIF